VARRVSLACVIAQRRGPFIPGDQVQLTDTKGRRHRLVLQQGRTFHTHHGTIAHDALLGQPEGSVVTSSAGMAYIALRPLLADYTTSMARGATVVYPKDAALILALADIFPGARVVEAGAGSGALSCWLLRAIGETGLLVSYERRPEFAEIARANVERYFGGPHPAWRLVTAELPASPPSAISGSGASATAATRTAAPSTVATAASAASATAATRTAAPSTVPTAACAASGTPTTDGPPTGEPADRMVLDMLSPWEVTGTAARWLVPGGLICCYLATVTQLSRTVEAIRAEKVFDEPQAVESLLRGWHSEGLAVRPEHRMIGHTGFLITARRLADGVTAPQRRRRPAKGNPGGGRAADGSQLGVGPWRNESTTPAGA
jgi:tRNA (adenine57-N1/adenine58-N1)-methyltransferase